MHHPHHDMRIQGRRFVVPEGSVVSLNVYALHRNPKHYPDPDAFRCVRVCCGVIRPSIHPFIGRRKS